MDDIMIQKAIEQYQKRLLKFKEHYQKKKEDETFMESNRIRAREYYKNNPNKKKEYYEMNKDIAKCKSMYNYYKKIDKLDIFKSKYPERYALVCRG
jgi:hypothetical protein